MLGSVPHSEVRDVLVRGNIFLNCSLTEAFCIAIVEAASCGLLVVSTRVGGVPEVLPDQLSLLAEPTTEGSHNSVMGLIYLDLLAKLTEAIENYKEVDHYAFHNIVKESYSWYDVASRTELVYDRICKEEVLPFIERIRRFAIDDFPEAYTC